jgi:uncharacterized protein YndB with AHSA1/START domain
MPETPDTIERSITIAGTAEDVWALVSVPGWWINDGTLRDHRIEQEGDLVVIHDEQHGLFRLRVGPLEPPRRAVFAWVPHSGGEAPESGVGTSVEFRIEDDPDGVRLTVIETGFAALDLPEERRRRNVEDNDEGWVLELEAARREIES